MKNTVWKFGKFAVTKNCAGKLKDYRLIFWLRWCERINLWVRESAPNKSLEPTSKNSGGSV